MIRTSPCLFAAAAALLSTQAFAGPTVWAIDDGEKIKQDATALAFANGTSNPVWAPQQPIKLFALRNETVAFQVVVQADSTALDGVTVDLPGLVGPAGAAIQNDPAATDPTNFVGRPIERFVEHYFEIARASGGSNKGVSLGWAQGSGPAAGAWTGLVPDALIPVEVAPSWDPYPMHVDSNRNAVVWVDVTVPAMQAAGTYSGAVNIAAAGQSIATLPLELDVIGATLPDRPVRTMLYYDRNELDKRIAGGDAAEANLWKLYHRHRLSPMHDALGASDATRHLPALTGAAFTSTAGYDGPGVRMGDGILSLGAYGGLGAPSANGLSQVEAIADILAQNNVFGSSDVFVYAADESCGSSYGAQWMSLLAGSSDPNTKNVRVGWTCSQEPTSQPVDTPIVFASSYDVASAASADGAGKDVWIYNGQRPETDAFFTDTSAIALRANGWIAAMANIPRWFYWETTFWYDNNNGGHGAYDPFSTAETFHNASGDWCEGDGVLVYPGKQVDVFTDHSIGLNGVLPSIRLKNLRRGIEDAGYYQLAHAANAAQAEAIAKALLPQVLSAATDGSPVSWSETGDSWFQARKALLAWIPQQAPAPNSAPSADAGALRSDAGDAGGDSGSEAGRGTTIADAGPLRGAGPGSAGGAVNDAGSVGLVGATGTQTPGGAGSNPLESASPSGGCACVVGGYENSRERLELAIAAAALWTTAWRRRRRRLTYPQPVQAQASEASRCALAEG
jgi:hypothetical protein